MPHHHTFKPKRRRQVHIFQADTAIASSPVEWPLRVKCGRDWRGGDFPLPPAADIRPARSASITSAARPFLTRNLAPILRATEYDHFWDVATVSSSYISPCHASTSLARSSGYSRNPINLKSLLHANDQCHRRALGAASIPLRRYSCWFLRAVTAMSESCRREFLRRSTSALASFLIRSGLP